MEVLRFNGFELRSQQRQLTRDGEVVPVGARAFDLLSYLVVHRDRVVSKAELLDHVWPGFVVEEANLSVHVSALRKVLGAHALATVPGRGYRFVAPIEPSTTAAMGSSAEPPLRGLGAATAALPSLAVMPFASLSDSPDQDLFADGLVEDVITTLSKIAGITVIARTSTFAFKGVDVDLRQVGRDLGVGHVLTGSVRHSAGRVRVSVQLVDAGTGAHLWAERYDRVLDDLFALQDELTLRVVTELQVHLTEGEQARLRGDSVRNVEAWSHWVRGMACYNRAVLTREGMTPALMSWQRAAAIAPDWAAVRALLGMLYYLDARFGFWNDRATAARKGADHVVQALSLDPECADAHIVQALLHLLQGRHGEAVLSARTALRCGPGAADVAAFASFVLSNAGLGPDAVTQIERAMRLCPVFPPFYLGHLGLAYRTAGRVPEAIAAFEAYDRHSPGRGVTDLALLNLSTGNRVRARSWAEHLIATLPGFTVEAWQHTQFRMDAAAIESDAAALRSLGLPG